MTKKMFSIGIFMLLIAIYALYWQAQQQKQHVEAVVSEAQKSLKAVQKNPNYHLQPIQPQVIGHESQDLNPRVQSF